MPAPTNVVHVTAKGLQELLPRYIKLKKAVHIWGSPGIGKSEIVAQVAKAMGYELRDVRGALLDPVDLRGLPHINGNGKVHWAIPEFLPTEADGKVMLFFDELNRSASMVQNSILQLVLSPHRLGEYQAPPDTAFIAAGNYESDGGGVQRMNAALANRFEHIHLHPSLDEWMIWALEHNVQPEIVAFLRLRPELLSQFDKNDYAFPTPRSWSSVSDYLSENKKDDLELASIAGAVGQGAASELLAFISLYRELPDVDALIANPTEGKVPSGNVLYAVVAALAHRATPVNFSNVLIYLERLSMEYMVMGVRDIAQRHPPLAKLPEFKNWVVKHPEVFE